MLSIPDLLHVAAKLGWGTQYLPVRVSMSLSFQTKNRLEFLRIPSVLPKTKADRELLTASEKASP